MMAKAIILLTMHAFRRMMGQGEPSISLNLLQEQKRKEVAEKVASGVYQFEEVGCLNCGSENSELIAERDRYGLQYSVKLCKDCGLAYTSPRMTGEAYGQFYDDEYRPLYVGSERAGDAFFQEQKKQGQRIYQYLRSKGVDLSQSLNVLEVGCGAGGILATFKEQGHCVVGIDLGSEYVQYGSQTHGLDLRVAYLKDLSIDFVPDLIIYSHVMEHILDPLAEMAEIQRRCGENTLVYIEVPGLKNIHKAYQMDVMKYYQNAHSAHFTLGSLSVMMSKCGFALSAGDEYVHAIYKLGNEVSSAKNEYDTTRQYLISTENKRWQYPFTTVAIKQFLKRFLKPVLG